MTARTKKIGILLLLIMVAVFSFFLLRSRTISPPPPPGQTVGAGYKSLVPGVSTKDQVIEKLGKPLNDSGSPVLEFKSTNPNLPHDVSIDKDTVIFIKEIVTLENKITKDGLLQLYGQTPETLFGPYSVNGFNLYVYPDKGVAFLGHLSGSVVLEIWYFQPTTIEAFIQKWGSGYSRVHRPIQ